MSLLIKVSASATELCQSCIFQQHKERCIPAQAVELVSKMKLDFLVANYWIQGLSWRSATGCRYFAFFIFLTANVICSKGKILKLVFIYKGDFKIHKDCLTNIRLQKGWVVERWWFKVVMSGKVFKDLFLICLEYLLLGQLVCFSWFP